MSNRDRRPPETEIRETIATDETIVELYWKRDETAIRLTDEKYGKYLYAIAYRILHDSLDCEECLNDTYLGTWNCIPPAKPNPLQLVVSKIMRNIAIDRFRGRMASRRVPSEMTVSLEELDECLSYSASPSEEYEMRELISILNGYLRSLPERQEFAFFCRYYYSDSVEDIAKMLAVSPATVYRELKNARDGLKICLEKEGYEL